MPGTIVKILSVLTACAGLAAAGSDFFAPGFDSGRELPADRVYPAGRIFPFTGFAPGSVESAKAAGFTMAGPVYSDYQLGKLMSQSHLLPLVYPLRAADGKQPLTRKLLDDPEIDLAPYIDSVARQVREAAANPNIGWWYLIPEEMRPWRKNDMEFLKRATEAIRKNDPQKRPVWMYLPNHYNREQMREFARHLDLIGKGMYPSQLGKENERVWCRWSTENEVGAIADAGSDAIAVAVVEMFRQPSPEVLADLETVSRHDLYLALVSGAKAVAVFSLAERPNFTAHKRYFEVYSALAREIAAPGGIGEALLFGKRLDELKIKIVSGPETVRTNVGLNGKTEWMEYPAVAAAEIGYRNEHLLILVNSSPDSKTGVEIEGLPANAAAVELPGEAPVGTSENGHLALTLKPYQTIVVKFVEKQ